MGLETPSGSKKQSLETRAETIRRYEFYRDIAPNLDLLVDLVIRGRAARIVELGVRDGGSTAIFRSALDTLAKGQLDSFDIVPDCKRRAETTWKSLGLGEFLTSWTFHCADSTVAWRDHGPRLTPIDLLFVDSSHGRDETLAELLGWSDYVRSSGLIACHDTLWDPPTRPVSQAIHEFLKQRPTWTVEYDNTGYGIATLRRKP